MVASISDIREEFMLYYNRNSSEKPLQLAIDHAIIGFGDRVGLARVGAFVGQRFHWM